MNKHAQALGRMGGLACKGTPKTLTDEERKRRSDRMKAWNLKRKLNSQPTKPNENV